MREPHSKPHTPLRHRLIRMTSVVAGTALLVTPFFAQTTGRQSVPAGTFTLLRDSDGTVPKAKATVTMTFRNGTLTMSAVQPGEEVHDTGTYSIAGNLITITFKEMEWEASRRPFTFDGCTLTLPFKALGGSGAGTSTWLSQAPACAQKPAATTPPQAAAPRATPVPEKKPQKELPAGQDTFDDTTAQVSNAIRSEIKGRKDPLRPDDYEALSKRLSAIKGVEEADYTGDSLGTFFIRLVDGGVLTWRHVTNDFTELATLPSGVDFTNLSHPKWNKGWQKGNAAGEGEDLLVGQRRGPTIQRAQFLLPPGQGGGLNLGLPKGETNTYATRFPVATGNPDPEYQADAGVSCPAEGRIAIVDFVWSEAHRDTTLYEKQFVADGVPLYDRIRWMAEAAGFTVDLFKDEEINLANFRKLEDYTIVIFIGHGARPGPKPAKRLGTKFTAIITAEKYDPAKVMYGMTYKEAWKKGYLTYNPDTKILDWTPMLFRDLYRPAKDQLVMLNECWAMLPFNVGLMKDEKGKWDWTSGVTGPVYNFGDGLTDARVPVVFGYISPATPEAIVFNTMSFFRRLFGGYYIKDAPPSPHIFWPTCMSSQTFFRMPGTPRLAIYGNRYFKNSAYTMYAVDEQKFFRKVCSPPNKHAYLQSFMLRVGTPATGLTNCWRTYWSKGKKVTGLTDPLCGQGDYPTTEQATGNAACAVKIARKVTNAMFRR